MTSMDPRLVTPAEPAADPEVLPDPEPVDVPALVTPPAPVVPPAEVPVPKHAAVAAVPDVPDTNDHWLPSGVYDTIKFLAQIFFPAVATLYFALADTWNLPRPEDVVGTIVAVDTFLGVFLAIDKKQFLNSDSAADGTVNVVTSPEGNKTFQLALNGDPSDLENQSTITFKVNAS